MACSGCVTSAETVLINQQSHEEFRRVLASNKLTEDKVIVVSLSHQSIASIALKYALTFQESAEKLSTLFVQLGATFVFDITLARHISLIEAQREFERKYEQKAFPIFNSVCPGWVCYVEKTHGNLVPYLSHVKSPQQIMGVIVKNFLKDRVDRDKSIYHVTLMPCYDKKLEASRGYFEDPETIVRDVDTVLTPVELEVLLSLEGIVLPSLPSRKLDFLHPIVETRTVTSHLGSGSGGYTENVFRFAANKLLGKKLDHGEKLVYKTRKNRDFYEIELKAAEGTLLFAVVNGFRNIQTLVQRMKRKTCDYQFIEVMACPSGCLNGGAQLRSDVVEEKFDKIDDVYKSLEITELPLDLSDERIACIYNDWFPTAETVEKYLYTEFKAVPKSVNLLNINW